MDSSDDDRSSSSDCASDMESIAKPLSLDPDTVRALAASTGCQELMIDEQSIDLNTNIPRHNKSRLRGPTISSSSRNDRTLSQAASEDEEDPILPRRIGKISSGEVKDGNSSRRHQKQSLREKEHIVSFLAFDPLSMEQLAAEADDGKKKQSNEIDGEGVARVDVHCRSGTVIVSRMFLVLKNDSTSLSEKYSRKSEAIVSSTMKARTVENTQIRRIIRQNVTQSNLRCIFSDPPKKTTIDESISASNSDDKDIMEQKLYEEYQSAHDEMARMHVANAIINTAMMGVGGDDLERVMQLDAFDCNPLEAGKTSKLLHDENDQLQSLQIEVREKINIADIGLAILMEEKRQLEKMMGIEKEVKRNHYANKSLEEDAVIQDDYSVESESSTSSSRNYDEAEEREQQSRSERIRIMGCEVEYSFASVLVDDLEAALVGRSNNDDDSSDSDDSCNDSCRGRSKTKRDILPGEIIPLKRQLRLSAITAIPTNGDGCVVLRDNGAFNVVGRIPKLLEKQLFQDDAPFPEYISLGSNNRFFVKFDDESYYVRGSTSLTRALNVKMSEKRKVKGKQRAKNNLSIASVAFGKDPEAFFVVFSDGSWECDGELHDELDKLLTDRGNRADLVWVSLGPNNEFCMKAKNGRIWWGGVSEEIGELLFDITDGNEQVDYISFGVDGSFFLTYHRH